MYYIHTDPDTKRKFLSVDGVDNLALAEIYDETIWARLLPRLNHFQEAIRLLEFHNGRRKDERPSRQWEANTIVKVDEFLRKLKETA